MFENVSSTNYPFSVNGGVPVGQPIRSAYSNLKHVEKNSFERFAGGTNQFLGLMKLWNHYNYVHTPLISMTELNKSVLETNGFNTTFTFGIPFMQGGPYIVENLCKDQSKVGLGKTAFPIVLSENKYTNGDILTSDFRNGKQLRVCTIKDYGEEAKITRYGDGYKYLVLVAGGMDDYYPQELLLPGTKYYKLYSDNGGEFENVLSTMSGMHDQEAIEMFQYVVGDSQMGMETWWTSDSQMITMDKATYTDHPSLQQLKQTQNMNALDSITNFFNIDPVTKKPIKQTGSWMPTFISKMVAELAEMKERKLLWGQGDFKITNGREFQTTGLGYYQQIKQRGNYYTYSDFRQLFTYLQNIGAMLFANNRNVKPDDRRIRWRMGSGAAAELRKEWGTFFKTDNPFLITGEHKALSNMLTADPKNGPTDVVYRPLRFSKIFMPEIGLIEFEVDPKLDYIDSNLEQDKYLGRLPNSAYMVFIEDLTAENFSNAIPAGQTNTIGGQATSLGNTVMIKPRGYVDQVNYLVGSGYLHPILAAYTGNKAGSSVVSTKEKGFGVMMYTCGEIWVQDPSRMILLEFKPEV